MRRYVGLLAMVLVMVMVLATGCGDDDGGSNTDGGVGQDAAPGSDAAPGQDAAPGSDAQTQADSGVPPTPADCDPLPAATGNTIEVHHTDADTLRQTVMDAPSGTTILLHDGEYDMSGATTSTASGSSRPTSPYAPTPGTAAP